MEDKRLAGISAGKAAHAAHEYQMVTARILYLVGALEPGRAAFN